MNVKNQTPSLPDADPRSYRFWCGGRESNCFAVPDACGAIEPEKAGHEIPAGKYL